MDRIVKGRVGLRLGSELASAFKLQLFMRFTHSHKCEHSYSWCSGGVVLHWGGMGPDGGM